jgi:hypothetical protein
MSKIDRSDQRSSWFDKGMLARFHLIKRFRSYWLWYVFASSPTSLSLAPPRSALCLLSTRTMFQPEENSLQNVRTTSKFEYNLGGRSSLLEHADAISHVISMYQWAFYSLFQWCLSSLLRSGRVLHSHPYCAVDYEGRLLCLRILPASSYTGICFRRPYDRHQDSISSLLHCPLLVYSAANEFREVIPTSMPKQVVWGKRTHEYHDPPLMQKNLKLGISFQCNTLRIANSEFDPESSF